MSLTTTELNRSSNSFRTKTLYRPSWERVMNISLIIESRDNYVQVIIHHRQVTDTKSYPENDKFLMKVGEYFEVDNRLAISFMDFRSTQQLTLGGVLDLFKMLNQYHQSGKSISARWIGHEDNGIHEIVHYSNWICEFPISFVTSG